MIRDLELSRADREMLHVLRRFRWQREELALQVPRRERKVAFMFLTKGAVPLAPLWERFFKVRGVESRQARDRVTPGLLSYATSPTCHLPHVPPPPRATSPTCHLPHVLPPPRATSPTCYLPHMPPPPHATSPRCHFLHMPLPPHATSSTCHFPHIPPPPNATSPPHTTSPTCHLQGHEGRYSIYVHASPDYTFPKNASTLFSNNTIRSGVGAAHHGGCREAPHGSAQTPPSSTCSPLLPYCLPQVGWGLPTMVDAERRLMAAALADPANHRFVLLSESCIPVKSFNYIWDYLMGTRYSFVSSFFIDRPVCSGRYDKHMQPKITLSQWRKGSQWFAATRRHVNIIIDDDTIHALFQKYCRGDKWHHHCYADEHYIPTLLNIKEPGRVANRTITYVDFPPLQQHPTSFLPPNITEDLFQNITEPLDYSLINVVEHREKTPQS
ncbi:unnamed protein product, partial [Closterium sp. Naga37s-1]